MEHNTFIIQTLKDASVVLSMVYISLDRIVVISWDSQFLIQVNILALLDKQARWLCCSFYFYLFIFFSNTRLDILELWLLLLSKMKNKTKNKLKIRYKSTYSICSKTQVLYWDWYPYHWQDLGTGILRHMPKASSQPEDPDKAEKIINYIKWCLTRYIV